MKSSELRGSGSGPGKSRQRAVRAPREGGDRGGGGGGGELGIRRPPLALKGE